MKGRNCWGLILNALHVIVLSIILCGAFAVQIFQHEEPCPLCLLQRLAMIGIACGELLNMRFGIKPLHYGVSLLSILFGAGVSLRQIALHVCPQFPTFGKPIWGLDLYAWAFLIFATSLLAIAIMLMLYDKNGDTDTTPKMKRLGTIAFAFIFLVGLGNIITAFDLCGWGPCD